MTAAVVEFAGVDLVERVVFTDLGCHEITVDGRNAGIGRHIVQPHFGSLDAGFGMTEINKGAG